VDRDNRAGASTAASALRRLFAARPAALLTDVDGTISHMTRRPMDAAVSTSLRQSLARLAQDLEVVTVVTGRAVTRAQTIVGVPEIGYVGNHGYEWNRDGQIEALPEAIAARPMLESALAAIRDGAPDEGLVVEDKGVTVAVHYRLSPHHAEMRQRMLTAVEPFIGASGPLKLIEGALVFNLLPNVEMDKGHAVVRLVEQHGLKSVAFFGDDITDLDAFRALHRLRAGGRVDTLAVGVLSAEGPPEIRELADLLLDGVDEVEAVLADLAARPLPH
jgi:trehalose 6-phosphate phosphatase